MRVAVRVEQSVRGGSPKELPAVRALRWYVAVRPTRALPSAKQISSGDDGEQR